jgi:hypothetical protein
MLQKRYVAGKWIYRVPGELIWSHSQMDARERAKQETQDVLVQLSRQLNTRHHGAVLTIR